MTHRMFSIVAAMTVAALPMALHAESNAPAAQRPARIATSPVAGAHGAAEAAKDASGAKADGANVAPEQRTKIQQFVVKEKKASTSIAEKVAVGVVLPKTVELFSLPADLHIKSDTRYTIVNERAVLVDAGSRKVTDLIN